MTKEELKFSEVLAARLCHDLAAPIGAVFNGVEFLQEVKLEDFQQQALNLISSNSKISVNRLKFFRYIYGPSYKDGNANLDELKILITEFLEDKKCSLVWDINITAQLTHGNARLMLILIYIASELLIKDGKITVTISNLANDKHVFIEGKGNHIKDPSHIIEILEHRDTPPKVENILIYIASHVATILKSKIEYEFKPDRFSLGFKI